MRAPESPSPIAASHAVTEDGVRDSGIPFTLLRNGWYTENYAHSVPAVRTSGVLLSSVGNGRVASATRQDLAEAIAPVVTGDGHEGKIYELSGDAAWSYDDLAAALSELLGRDVVHQSLSPEQHLQTLIGAGVPEPMAQMAVGADAGIAAGARSPTPTATSPGSSADPPPRFSRGCAPSSDLPRRATVSVRDGPRNNQQQRHRTSTTRKGTTP